MKVGDYVRTKDGFIGKYHIEKEYQTIPMWQDKSRTKFEKVEQEYINNKEYDKYEIIKSSPNIIDLIELGDIVRGKDNHLFEVYAVGSDSVYINNLEEFILIDEIKSIVTKEQFKTMEYHINKEE